MHRAEEAGAEAEARDLKLRLANGDLLGRIHDVTFKERASGSRELSRTRQAARAELGEDDRDEEHGAVEHRLGVGGGAEHE